MINWRDISNLRVFKSLRMKSGATIVTENSDGTTTSLSVSELAALNDLATADLAKIDGITNGTAAAGKAVVLDSNSAIDLVKFGAIGASDSALAVDGQAAAQGGTVDVKGGTSSTAGNAGGASTLTGGTPGSTGVGGAATVAAGAGGSASGNGGVASLTGGAGTAGNALGGIGKTVGGAGQGTGAGGAAQLTGGASGAGATGNGGATSVTGGAAASTNGNGGSVVLAGGAKTGTGVAGMVIERSVKLVAQGAQTAKTTSATLTAAEVLAGIITVNQGGGATSSLTLPLATDMDTAMPDAAAGDAFNFSLINISTVAAEDADILTNTGWTLVGSMAVQSNAAITDKSAGAFRARKTATGAWTLYRMS